MIEIKCPNEWTGGNLWSQGSLFLGGGITGTPDWQPMMVEMLKDTRLVLINPRRDEFDISDPEMTTQQIEWEHKYLERVTGRMFWFPCETLCPITLFELGKYCQNTAALFVGCHPDYKRRVDVEVQMGLARPWYSAVHSSLEEMAGRIKTWAERVS